MKTQARRLAPAARGGIPVPTRIPASERTSQKLDELLTQGVADGDARAELLKLAVKKIVEEALEAEVADALGRDYYENGAARRSAFGSWAQACCWPIWSPWARRSSRTRSGMGSDAGAGVAR